MATNAPPALAQAIAQASTQYGVPVDILTGVWRVESASSYPNPYKNPQGYGGLFGTTDWNGPTQEQANYAASTLAKLYSQFGSWAAALYHYSGGGYTSVPGQSTAGGSFNAPVKQHGAPALYGADTGYVTPQKTTTTTTTTVSGGLPGNPYDPLKDPVDWAAWNVAMLEAQTLGTGATAATGSAIGGATAAAQDAANTAGAIANLPRGLQAAVRGLLPTTAHVYRAFFVGLGLAMIAVGALIYFRGDDIWNAAKAGAGEAAKAGEVAAVAA